MKDQDILSALDARKELMIDQIYQLCSINSSSNNLDGLQIMLGALRELFYPLGDLADIISMPAISSINLQGNPITLECGDALFIRKRPECKRRILLMGHMDTVYPLTSPFQTVKALSSTRLNGPGVADMKGGLIVLLHALSLFEKMPQAAHLGWDVFITADEEIGSPSSSPFLASIAQQYQAAFVYEPALEEGYLAKNRKGSGKLALIAHGRAAHAGRAFNEGKNAICYLAEAIIAVNALNGKKEGVTINIGLMSGGEALNVVPAMATAQLDIRISQPEDACWVKEQLQSIIHQLARQGYDLTLQGTFHRPVKKVSQPIIQLFNRVKKISERLSFFLDWKDSGGCCDGNNLSNLGVPVLDNLGVCGGKIHSTEEFLELSSLTERGALSALLLKDLAEGGLEEIYQ